MMILVTGGSGSGKSSFAEDCIVSFGNARRIYIATMYPFDEESKKRVKRHQAMRQGKGFDTLECYTGLVRAAIPEGSTVLLECMSNLAANEFYHEDGSMEEVGSTCERILKGVSYLVCKTPCLVIVTNEVNSDINGYSPETEQYRQMMGMVNQRIASLADQVTEVVYGIPVLIKDEQNME